MSTLGYDLRLAFRALRKYWTVTLLATGSLALAIAGNSTVFSLIDGLLFRPYPYREAEELLMVWERKQGDLADFPTISPANFLDYRERTRALEEMAAFRTTPVNLEGTERAEQLTAAAASANLFHLLGVDAAKGRTFLPDEGRPGLHRVAVLSHQLWEDRFGSDQLVVGRTMILDGEPFTVVGVMAPGFELISPTIQLWIPLILERGNLPRERRDLLAFARLREGASLEQARLEISELGRQLEEQYPQTNRDYQGRVETMRDRLVDPRNRQLFGLLQGALIFVLLISCANIANLLLVRGCDRQQEFALLAALGAGRWQLVRQLLLESLILALLGGVLGIFLAAWGIAALNTMLAPLVPGYQAPALDQRVMAFTLAMTALSGLLFGFLPSLQGTRINLVQTLKEAGHGAPVGSSRRLLSRTLIVVEISLALILLGGAGVLIRSFFELQHSEPGFRMYNLLTMQLSLPRGRYIDDEEVTSFFENLLERLEGLPGVSAVTTVNSLPRNPFNPSTTLSIEGRPPELRLPSCVWLSVPPGYLKTLEIPLLNGRPISGTDRSHTLPVVLINNAMARRFWPQENPVGRRITIHGKSREVIGVTADVSQGLVVTDEGPPSVVYFPHSQLPVRTVSLVLRTRVDPHSLAAPARAVLRDLDPDLSVGQVLTLEEFTAKFFVGASIFTAILTGFGALALLLAAMGIYGLLSYSVAQRTHEIGIRMALGARPSQIVRMILRQGMILVAIGFGVGIPGVLAVTRIISSALAGVAPVEPLTILGVSLFLLLITGAATYFPARRASALDPVLALRHQ